LKVPSGYTVLGVLGVAAAVTLQRTAARKSVSSKALLLDAFNQAAETVDQRIGWHQLPTPLGLVVLIGIRNTLRKKNLYSTASIEPAEQAAIGPRDARYLTARTVDGSYNDLEQPSMGATGTRFGRNVPLDKARREPEDALLTPNPRTISVELLTRDTFKPAITLNVLAAAWLQFETRDWFSHGRSETDNPRHIPLREGDPWPERPMHIERIRRDPWRGDAADGAPPTSVNHETHWWDASQIYGSTPQFHTMMRLRKDGKLNIGPDRLVHMPPAYLVELGSVAGWWLGLGMLGTLFILEHNAICDRLKMEYPTWSDDDIFDHARLINAALIAKIHTVEWTTAILGHPALQIGMRANWWGIAEERIYNLLGRISESEVISGIPGSHTHHYHVPYTLTEEFVAVYRMHPLIPDDYVFRSVADDRVLKEHTFTEIAGLNAQGVLEQVGMQDLLYSFGIAHPGAVVLHNFPRALQMYQRPDGVKIDLAAIDIMRSREMGVPRYNEFRRLLHLRPARTFEELTDNAVWQEELRRVYEGDVEKVDLTVGLFAEKPPKGFGFSDTAFRIFVLMASRRLNSDRFFTTDYTPQVYTQTGMDWINKNDMSTVLLRHYPGLRPALRGVKNAFAPWSRVSA